MIRRTIVHRRNRTKMEKANNEISVPANPTFQMDGADDITMTLDVAVTLNGVPQIVAQLPLGGGPVLPTGAVMVSPNVITLQYGTTIDQPSGVVVPVNDPAARTSTGGPISSGAFAVAP